MNFYTNGEFLFLSFFSNHKPLMGWSLKSSQSLCDRILENYFMNICFVNRFEFNYNGMNSTTLGVSKTGTLFANWITLDNILYIKYIYCILYILNTEKKSSKQQIWGASSWNSFLKSVCV